MMLWFCIFSLIIIEKSSQNEYDIVRSIFVGYNKDLRPSFTGEPTQVYITPDLTWILDVDEKQETLLYRQWLPMLWNDPFLQWDPNAFGGTKKIYIPVTRIWRPDVSVQNANQIIHIIPPEEVYAEIDHNGNVTVEFLQDVYIRCSIEVEYFPFDTQTCQSIYGSWAYPMQEVKVQDFTPQFELDLVTTHPEWKITEPLRYVDSDIYSYAYFEGEDGDGNRTYEELHYNITIKRQPMFYMVTVALPILLITCVCIIGVFTPNNSHGIREEKVTLGLTTLLAMAVFLNIITDEMPKSGTGIPFLGSYILSEMIAAGVATATSAVIMFVHELSFTRQWPWPKNRRKKRPLSATKSFKSNAQEDVKQIIEGWLKEKKMEDKTQKKWSLLFDRIDLFCLVVFLSGNILLTLDMYRHVVKMLSD